MSSTSCQAMRASSSTAILSIRPRDRTTPLDRRHGRSRPRDGQRTEGSKTLLKLRESQRLTYFVGLGRLAPGPGVPDGPGCTGCAGCAAGVAELAGAAPPEPPASADPEPPVPTLTVSVGTSAVATPLACARAAPAGSSYAPTPASAVPCISTADAAVGDAPTTSASPYCAPTAEGSVYAASATTAVPTLFWIVAEPVAPAIASASKSGVPGAAAPGVLG